MNEEFYRRQTEGKQGQDHNAATPQKNSTLETYHLEQQEAHSGHIASPVGADGKEEQLSLWQRIRRMIGL